jgi:hypothetical protein
MKPLYDRGIRYAKRLAIKDLKAIAHFNRIVKNYEKMCEIERRSNADEKKMDGHGA